MAGIKKHLREEYFPKPKKVDATSLADDDVVADTKVEEKFEPFYEGEEGKGPTPSESST